MLLVSTGPASSSLGPVHVSVPPQEGGGTVTAVLSSKRHSAHVTADHMIPICLGYIIFFNLLKIPYLYFLPIGVIPQSRIAPLGKG